MLAGSRRRAKEAGLAHNITEEDIHIPKVCPVLGIPLTVGVRSQREASASLDRIDNSKGYVRGNVVVMSWRANKIKSDATVEELAAVVRFLRKHLRRK